MNNLTQKMTNLLYLYTQPSYYKQSRNIFVKIERVEGYEPNLPSKDRVLSQISAFSREDPIILSYVVIPDRFTEFIIYDYLTRNGVSWQELSRETWFCFKSREELDQFINKLKECELINDFSYFGSLDELIKENPKEQILSKIQEIYGITEIRGGIDRNRIPKGLINEVIKNLSPKYSGFSYWFKKSLSDEKIIINIAKENNDCSGVLLWKEQSPKQVKLSILFVGQEFRSRQVGESLMLYSLQQWYKKKYESVFVKTSEQDLINFFEKFGFSLQGIRRSIYDRNRKNEYILSKKFIYEKEIDPALIKVK